MGSMRGIEHPGASFLLEVLPDCVAVCVYAQLLTSSHKVIPSVRPQKFGWPTNQEKPPQSIDILSVVIVS